MRENHCSPFLLVFLLLSKFRFLIGVTFFRILSHFALLFYAVAFVSLGSFCTYNLTCAKKEKHKHFANPRTFQSIEQNGIKEVFHNFIESQGKSSSARFNKPESSVYDYVQNNLWRRNFFMNFTLSSHHNTHQTMLHATNISGNKMNYL